MPKLILATAAIFLRRPLPPAADTPNAMHSATRTREDTRRLRTSRAYEARFDLGPLELTRRH
jgi:hypothetical protein